MASEAKEPDPANDAGNDKGKDDKSPAQEKEDDKAKDDKAKDDNKDTPEDNPPGEEEGKKTPVPRPPSAQKPPGSRPNSSKSRPASSKSVKPEDKPDKKPDKAEDSPDPDKTPTPAPDESPSDETAVISPEEELKHIGEATPDSEKPTSPDTRLSTPKDSPVLTSPKLVTPRNLVSPPLTSRTIDRPRRDGFCQICPQMQHLHTAKADFYCDHCEQRFCLRCARRHIETPVFANHDLEPLLTSEADMRGLQELPCKVHPQRRLEYYCVACQLAACGMCITFNHGGQRHQNMTVDKLPGHRHVLLYRYELLRSGEQQPAAGKPTATPDAAPLVPFLLWKCESVSRAAQHLKTSTLEEESDPSQLRGPCDIAFLPGGQVVVADRWNQSVKLFNAEGTSAQVVLERLSPLRVCCTPAGRVAVVDDQGQGQIKVINPRYLKDLINHSKGKQNDELNEANNGVNTLEEESMEEEHEGVGTTEDGNNSTPKHGESKDNKDNNDNREPTGGETSPANRQVDKSSTSKRAVGPPPPSGAPPGVSNSKQPPSGAPPGVSTRRSTSKQGTRGRQSIAAVNAEIFRDLSIILKSDDGLQPEETWKPVEMNRPMAIVVNRLGQWIVSEYQQYIRSNITIYDMDGTRVRAFGGIGDKDDQFEWPAYLASDTRGRIVVSDYYNHTVKIFDQRGKFVSKLGKGWGKKDGHLTFPKGVCVDSDDHILVVDSGNNRVCEFAPNGEFVRNVLTNEHGLFDPEGIAFVEVPEEPEPEPQPEQSDASSTGGVENSKKARENMSDSNEQTTIEGDSERRPYPRRRLAVTLCKGHEYSALLVYGLEQAELVS